MKKQSSRKPVWVVIEPFFYPHSEGYLRAILQDKSILETFDILYVYGGEISQQKLMCELEEAFGSSFRSIRVDHSRRGFFGYGITAFTLNILSRGICKVLKSGFFKKLLFLDHGICKPVQKLLGPAYDNVTGEAVDPWTEADNILCHNEVIVDGKRTLLTLGAHSVRKGTISLLKMFRDYPEKLANYRLLVVGPVRDDIREDLDRLLSEIKNSSNNVECIDRYVSDSDSWSYFKRSDIVICPYVNFHGSSNVVIRAAAAGLPVVAPSFGFLGEVAEHGGIGVTYKEQQPGDILEAIFKAEKLLADNRQEVGRNCEKYARRHHASLYAASLLLPLTNRFHGVSRAK